MKELFNLLRGALESSTFFPEVKSKIEKSEET